MLSLLNIYTSPIHFFCQTIAKDDKLVWTSNKKLIINISTFHRHSHAPLKTQISAINFPLWIAIKTTSGPCVIRSHPEKAQANLY